MRLCRESSPTNQAEVLGPLAFRNTSAPAAGFTLMEVMVVMSLMTILMVCGLGGILSMRLCSTRLTDYTAALSVVEAKLHDIRAATYNPPNHPFGSSTIYVTNNRAIALNQAGAIFQIHGKIVSKIQPVAGGHLVTVTGTFDAPSKPISISLQSVVNRYSGGLQ